MVALFLLMPLLALYRIRLIGLGHRRNGVFLMDYPHVPAHSATALLPVSLPPLVVLKLGIDAWATYVVHVLLVLFRVVF